MSADIVFVGEANEGKTTIVSSLIEDEYAKISSKPGTTQIAHRHQLRGRNGEVIIRLWDTPGFSNTDDLHAWFTSHAKTGEKNLVRRFIQEHETDPDWKLDVELLKPISEGALVVYVAASNRKPLPSTDNKQLEVIRLTGASRIALINKKPGKDYTGLWQELFRQEIGDPEIYEPLHAGIRERLLILDRLAHCSQTHRESLLAARDNLSADWEHRLEELTRMMMSVLVEAVQTRCTSNISKVAAETELRLKMRTLEDTFRGKARTLFHHSQLKIESDVFEPDIMATDFWKLHGLGLTRKNAIIWGTAVGAVGGFIVDASSGGFTLGIPTVAGGAIGGLGTLVAMYHPMSSNWGKEGHEVWLNGRSQVINVLLDRMIYYSQCLLQVSHGARPEEAIQLVMSRKDITDGEKRLSAVDTWNKQEKTSLATLVGKSQKSGIRMVDLENKVKQDWNVVYERILNDLKS